MANATSNLQSLIIDSKASLTLNAAAATNFLQKTLTQSTNFALPAPPPNSWLSANIASSNSVSNGLVSFSPNTVIAVGNIRFDTNNSVYPGYSDPKSVVSNTGWIWSRTMWSGGLYAKTVLYYSNNYTNTSANVLLIGGQWYKWLDANVGTSIVTVDNSYWETITTTTTTTANVQTGTQLVINGSTTTVQTIGNFVTDITLNPYMENRVISFMAFGMRPNQRVHIFFDSINVDQYCAPGFYLTSDITVQYPQYTNPSNNDLIISDSDNNRVLKIGDWGTAIYADDRGVVAGQFNIPRSTFKSGERALEIADVDSLAMGMEALTTYAKAIYTASSLNVTKQTATLTTVNPIISSVPIYETVTNTITTSANVWVNSTSNVIISNTYGPPPNWAGPSPLAQILTIQTPAQESGVFATEITVYFKSKSQMGRGASVYILNTIAGNPDGNSELPFSRSHLTVDRINVSDDASLGTKFVFPAPVFLENNKQYALVVKADMDDPDYDLWTAKLGDRDIQTNSQIFMVPMVGIMFEGPTFWQWSPINDEYMKFELNIANFNASVGTAILNNTNDDIIETYFNIVYANSSAGILPGDIVYGSTNSSPNTVNTSIYGLLDYFDEKNKEFYIKYSSGNFNEANVIQIHRFSNGYVGWPWSPQVPNGVVVPSSVNTTPIPDGNTFVASGKIFAITNHVINAIVPQYAIISPPGTSVGIDYKGTTNNYAQDTSYKPTSIGVENEFYDFERVLASKSNENQYLSGEKSLTNRITLYSDSNYLSPMIDLIKSSDLIIENIIDSLSSDYNEFFDYGSSKAKYISQVITLAPGQDAQDLQVILSAHRPPGSDVQVWARFLHREDTDPITEKTWTPLKNVGRDMFSSENNPSDFLEFVYSTCPGYPLLYLSGTFDSNTSSANLTGNNTNWGSLLQPGWFVGAQGNNTTNEEIKKIVEVVSNTQIVLESPFNVEHVSDNLFLSVPPTTAWMGSETSLSISGEVSTTTDNNSIIGNNTYFNIDFKVGDIISVGGDSQVITSITNSTFLNVGTPWSINNSNFPAFNKIQTGLSYLNKDDAFFNTFMSFQIKIILQSNDSSKVPRIDNLRVLALQL